MSSTSRLLLVSLVANADSIEDVANELKLDADLVTRGINDYSELGKRDLTTLDSTVGLYVENTLQDSDGFRYAEITDFATALANPDYTVDTTLSDKFFAMVANNDIPPETFEQFEIIFGNLTQPQAESILDAIGKDEIKAQALADSLTNDNGRYFWDDAEFWEVARDYYDTD